MDARKRLSDAMARTAAGDAAGFRDVYRLTHAKLFSSCLQICGERQAAEDTLHEVYLAVWRRAGSFDPTRASAMTWLLTIVRNRSIDLLREQKRRAYVSIDEVPPVIDASPTAVDSMISADDVKQLRRCLHGLERDQLDLNRVGIPCQPEF